MQISSTTRTLESAVATNVVITPAAEVTFAASLDKVKPGHVEQACFGKRVCPFKRFCEAQEGENSAKFTLSQGMTMVADAGNCGVTSDFLIAMLTFAEKNKPTASMHDLELTQSVAYALASKISTQR